MTSSTALNLITMQHSDALKYLTGSKVPNTLVEAKLRHCVVNLGELSKLFHLPLTGVIDCLNVVLDSTFKFECHDCSNFII